MHLKPRGYNKENAKDIVKVDLSWIKMIMNNLNDGGFAYSEVVSNNNSLLEHLEIETERLHVTNEAYWFYKNVVLEFGKAFGKAPSKSATDYVQKINTSADLAKVIKYIQIIKLCDIIDKYETDLGIGRFLVYLYGTIENKKEYVTEVIDSDVLNSNYLLEVLLLYMNDYGFEEAVMAVKKNKKDN